MKIVLDTKKITNPDCGLDTDGKGSPSTLDKVYMHSGLCSTSKELLYGRNPSLP